MNTLQRGMFFQTTGDAGQRKSPFRFGERGVILAVLLFLSSCGTLTPERVAVLAAIAGQAAQVGAEQWLVKHPQHRPAFEMVIAAISALVKGGVTNQAAYAELLQSLPTSTLAGPSGELYVTADRLVIWDAKLEKAVAVEGAATEPVLKATVRGMTRALAPQPPVPTARFRYLGSQPTTNVTPIGSPLVIAPVGKSPTAKPLVAAAGSLPVVGAGAAKTNVTRSIVDVTPHAGNLSVVTVKWMLGAKSVYHIEHCATGTNWQRVGCLTNVAARGQTNWAMPWLPNAPVGQFRVLRVR